MQRSSALQKTVIGLGIVIVLAILFVTSVTYTATHQKKRNE